MTKRAGVAGPAAGVAVRLAGLSGWRRMAAAAALGAAAGLAHPPYHALPLLVVAFTGLAWLLEGTPTARGAFLCGWCFGFGQLLVGAHWVGAALLVDADVPVLLAPLTVVLLAGAVALFFGLATAAARTAAPPGAWRIVALAAAWPVAEWLRAHVLFGGFPWHLVGYVWAPVDAMIQPAALFGVYGLGALTVLASAAPAALVSPSGRGGRRGVVTAGAAAFLLTAMWIGGAVRLAGADAGAVEGVGLRVVQPNVPQSEKGRPEHSERHLRRHLALSAATGDAGAPAADGRRTLVIWPETATAFLTALAPNGRRRMAAVLGPGDLLVTGSPRRGERTASGHRRYNSVHLVDGGARIAGTYDKRHLVPFGEYLPLRALLSPLGVEGLAAGYGALSAGRGTRTLRLPGLPAVRPVICFESLFPHEVGAGERPGWLLNPTSDGWFGESAGIEQLFAVARFRAVEQGLPLVRAANTGVSGVVDPYGRVLARLDVSRAGVIDQALPRALPATPYARAGDVLPIGAALLVLLALGLRRWVRRY